MSKEIPKINNPLDFISDSELHSDENGMLSLDVGDASVSLYVAWVPCLAGQIFYSLSDPGLADFDLININQLDHDQVTHAPKCRYILSSSVVDWKDSGNKDESGLARVVVLASATSLQKLSGDVFVIPFHKDGSDYDKNKQHAILTEDLYQISKKENLSGGTSDNVGNRVCTKEFKDLFDPSDQNEGSLISKLKLLDGWFVHQVSFEMDDAGFTYLYCSGLKPKNKKSFNLDADIVKSITSPIHTITRQSFYYLKYLFHKHSHHEHGTDSVTTIHRCRADHSIVAHALLGDLKKGLVDEKRANKCSLYEAEGIATYGRSLAISCQRKGFLKRMAHKLLNHCVLKSSSDIFRIYQTLFMFYDRIIRQ